MLEAKTRLLDHEHTAPRPVAMVGRYPTGTPAVGEWLEDSFERDKDARFLVGAGNRLELANEKARQLLDHGLLTLAPGRQLRLNRPRSQSILDEAMNAARRNGGAWYHRVLPLADGEWSAVRMRLIQPTAALVEIVVRPIHTAPIDTSSVADAFGLTLMESRVLRGLAEAQCPKTIAQSNHISVHTVRAHVRSIYAKLGTRSAQETQSFVLALLA